MDKEDLRVRIRRRLSELDRSLKTQYDDAIRQRLLTSGLLHGSVCIYRSLPQEVDTRGLIAECANRCMQIWIPAVRGNEIVLIGIDARTEWTIGAYGIEEPLGREFLPEEVRLDVCVTPLLAADRSGNRLGKGKGFYDRFFAKNECVSAALAYDLQICEKIPAQPHDKKMDYIVTEKEIITAL